MIESAVTGLRERKSRATAVNITAVSRRLTIAQGLSGFTIDEVCREVGISRRTFFNYFPSKEDAIIGADSEGEAEGILDGFMNRVGRGWPAAIADLIELVAAHFDAVGADANEHAEFVATLEAEPRLLARFVGLSREREKALTMTVASREGVDSADPNAIAVVSVFSTIIRNASEAFIAPSNAKEFSTLLTSTLAAFRAVLARPQ